MPDFMSVCMQDIMYCCKPKLRKEVINNSLYLHIENKGERCFLKHFSLFYAETQGLTFKQPFHAWRPLLQACLFTNYLRIIARRKGLNDSQVQNV